MRPRPALAAAVAVAALAASPARPDSSIVPGLMGYNALPALPLLEPAVGDRTEVELGAAAQASGLDARDAAATPYFRASLPFREVAAIDVDGAPVEWWRVSPATRARLGARSSSGLVKGDLRFGGRFLLFRETAGRPALGVALVMKSTTGKGLANRRFTSAPGYVVDALAAKDLVRDAGAVRRLRVLAKLGFAAWQLGFGDQDDAVDWGLGARAWLPWGTLSAECRGYRGFLRRDRPALVGLSAGRPLSERLEAVSTVNLGVSRDAPPVELRVGVVGRFDLAAAFR